MAKHTTKIEIEYCDGVVKEYTVPMMYEICPQCKGHGNRAMGGMAFTSSEFVERFDDADDRAAYFSGRYDTLCEVCNGSGKVEMEDITVLPQDVQDDYRRQEKAKALYASYINKEKRDAANGWAH